MCLQKENNICAAAICGKTIKSLWISCGDKRPLVPPEVINCLSSSFFSHGGGHTSREEESAKKCFPKLGWGKCIFATERLNIRLLLTCGKMITELSVFSKFKGHLISLFCAKVTQLFLCESWACFSSAFPRIMSGWPSGLRRQTQGSTFSLTGRKERILVHWCGRGFEPHPWQKIFLVYFNHSKNSATHVWFEQCLDVQKANKLAGVFFILFCCCIRNRIPY